VRKPDAGQAFQAASFLLCVSLALKLTSGLDGTEFSEGGSQGRCSQWRTMPLFFSSSLWFSHSCSRELLLHLGLPQHCSVCRSIVSLSPQFRSLRYSHADMNLRFNKHRDFIGVRGQ